MDCRKFLMFTGAFALSAAAAAAAYVVIKKYYYYDSPIYSSTKFFNDENPAEIIGIG